MAWLALTTSRCPFAEENINGVLLAQPRESTFAPWRRRTCWIQECFIRAQAEGSASNPTGNNCSGIFQKNNNQNGGTQFHCVIIRGLLTFATSRLPAFEAISKGTLVSASIWAPESPKNYHSLEIIRWIRGINLLVDRIVVTAFQKWALINSALMEYCLGTKDLF